MSPKTTIKYLLFLMVLMVAAVLLSKAQAPAKTAVPTIPVELKAKLFKAQAQQMNAQNEFAQAQKNMQDKFAALQAVIQEANTVCGATASLQLNKAGDPVCTAKPVPPAPTPVPVTPAKK